MSLHGHPTWVQVVSLLCSGTQHDFTKSQAPREALRSSFEAAKAGSG